MLRFDFTEEEKKQLQYERFHHPHPRVQQKMEALWLKSQGLPHHQIAQLVNISGNTLRSYLYQYQEGGIDALKVLPFHKPESAYVTYQSTILEEFSKNPPHTSKEAAHRLEELTGIKRQPQAARIYLHSLGFSFRKVGLLPAKADVQEQNDFQKKKLDPLLDEAKKGKGMVYFADAAHFIFGAYLGYLWCLVKLFVRAPSGRNRFNVLAAVNAISREIVQVTNTTSVHKYTVWQLLRLLRQKHPIGKITLILDNATYFRANFTKAMAFLFRIELLFLPCSSPNLNLIERLWKFIRKKCLYSRHYEEFDDFCFAISTNLEKCNSDPQYRTELCSLLTLKFQSFEMSQSLTV